MLHLIAALLIVVGLATSAPPACLCATDEHFGLALHPLFPHSHGSAHADDLDRQPGRDTANPAAQADWRSAMQAPGISAQGAGSGVRDVIAGMLMPALLLAVLLDERRRCPVGSPGPVELTHDPPTPPPRLLAAA